MKRESQFTLRPITREEFVREIDDNKANKFAKTFVAKADMLGRWDACVGAFTASDNLAAAVLWTLSKKKPTVCNLQLLHTFADHRGKGAAKELMRYAEIEAIRAGAKYFRVSAEPDAVEFYKKIGYLFWGKQKSGCQLCMFELPGIYQANDPVVYAAIHKKGKGGVVELSEFYHENINLQQNFLQALLNND